jgi:signal transduction histidine kinase
MKLSSYIRRHFGLKIFLSFLVIILVGVVVLATAAELVIPTAFQRHMGVMADMMEEVAEIPSEELELDLYNSFRAAVIEALTLATVSALLVAVIVSILISRQVVAPVMEMTKASQRIAEGHYDERVQVGGNLSAGEQDELGRLALNFNQMANKLEQVETMRRELIADISHELRTPLTAIKGSMEGLMDGILSADEATFQQIHQDASRLARLVDDLQELSRVEAGAFDLKIDQVRVSDLVGAAVGRLGWQFDEKGVKLEVDVPDSLSRVLVDQDRLAQVLLNLLGNALQYTPAGGKVSISARQQERVVMVSIADTGLGIQAEHLPHIFTRFYRIDKSRSRAGGGSGIGLTVARYLVEAHGGRLWVHSEGLGKGSIFTFSLPAVR